MGSCHQQGWPTIARKWAPAPADGSDGRWAPSVSLTRLWAEVTRDTVASTKLGISFGVFTKMLWVDFTS